MSKESTQMAGKKQSGGFTHFIHNLENAPSRIFNDIKNIPHKLEESVHAAEQKAEDAARAAGRGLKELAENAGDLIKDLEDKDLPSAGGVISETALLVFGGLLVTVLVFKFL